MFYHIYRDSIVYFIMPIFEVVMLVCFAASWPFSIIKAIRTKVVAGKSPLFMTLILIGYTSGVLYKCTLPGPIDWRVWLYVLNFLIVGIDLFLYYLYRNRVPGNASSPSKS